ncbi:MAG: rhomboid family intramembrane serine protease [Bacteroidetes bacterium]|nr:MAG: rhomboid family intramembrane serine protease [Bacteroidota bacterium]
MSDERKRFIYSLVFPVFFLVVIWMVRFFETAMEISMVEGGVYPRKFSGLQGVFFSPLIHADWKHLLDNSSPVLFLSVALFYFYRDIAYRIWILIYFISGILLWGLGRQAYHIGASGLIYGLAAFLFLSGLIRGVRSLIAISLLVVFWYSGLVWGLLPYDYQVSFEAHLTGAISGILLALLHRDLGPEPEKSILWEEEEETQPETGERGDRD